MLTRQDYIENILDHHDRPRNKRALEPADIEASGGNPGCGDIVVMYANVDPDGRIVEASLKVAVRVVVVDAIDAEAVAFYERFGFVAVPEHPHRLFQKMSDIEAAYFAD